MTHPNIDLIRRYSEALTAGKAADALPFYTEDLALHIPGRSPHAGTFRGQDAVLAYYTRLFRDTDGAFTPLGVDDILASDDHGRRAPVLCQRPLLRQRPRGLVAGRQTAGLHDDGR